VRPSTSLRPPPAGDKACQRLVSTNLQSATAPSTHYHAARVCRSKEASVRPSRTVLPRRHRPGKVGVIRADVFRVAIQTGEESDGEGLTSSKGTANSRSTCAIAGRGTQPQGTQRAGSLGSSRNALFIISSDRLILSASALPGLRRAAMKPSTIRRTPPKSAAMSSRVVCMRYPEEGRTRSISVLRTPHVAGVRVRRKKPRHTRSPVPTSRRKKRGDHPPNPKTTHPGRPRTVPSVVEGSCDPPTHNTPEFDPR